MLKDFKDMLTGWRELVQDANTVFEVKGSEYIAMAVLMLVIGATMWAAWGMAPN